MRNKGTFNFAATFEVQAKQPLDARQVVGTYADLTQAATWQDVNNNIWLYNGAIVSIATDSTPTLNGLYQLIDVDNYTQTTAWKKLGDSTGNFVPITQNLNGTIVIITGDTQNQNLSTSVTDGNYKTTIIQSNNSIMYYANSTGSTEAAQANYTYNNIGNQITDGNTTSSLSQNPTNITYSVISTGGTQSVQEVFDISGINFAYSNSNGVSAVQAYSGVFEISASNTVDSTKSTSIALENNGNINITGIANYSDNYPYSGFTGTTLINRDYADLRYKSITGTTINALSGLTDTHIINPQVDDILQYSGNTWVNEAPVDIFAMVNDLQLLRRSGTAIIGYTPNTFIASGNTKISISTGNSVTIYSSSGKTYTFIPSGSTSIKEVGNNVTIYSPSGLSYTFIPSGGTKIKTSGTNVTIYSSTGGTGAVALSGLTDTHIISPSTDDILQYSGSAWYNEAPVDIFAHVSDGQTFKRSGSTIVGYIPSTGTTVTWSTLSGKPTWVGSGATTVTLVGSNYRIYTPATDLSNYYNKTQINNYTGATSTSIGNRLLTTVFSTYTGTTAPSTYYNKTQINNYTGATSTSIGNRLLTTIYSTYTGTTAPNAFASKSFLSTYTGTTAPATFASKSLAITGATNLGSNSIYTSVSANKIQLKGFVASGGTTVTTTATDIKITTGTIAAKQFWTGTQAAYTALGSWDANTLYFCT